MITRDELMHHRLQSWLRENDCDDINYEGYYQDLCGISRHWYNIKGHIVSVDCIEGIEKASNET